METIQIFEVITIVLLTIIIFLGVSFAAIFGEWKKEINAHYTFQKMTIRDYKLLNNEGN